MQLAAQQAGGGNFFQRAQRLRRGLVAQVEGAVVHGHHVAGAQHVGRLGRFVRVHVAFVHHEGRLIGANGHQDDIYRPELLLNSLEVARVGRVAAEVDAAPRTREKVRAPEPVLPVAGAGETVLVVDDEPSVRMLVTDVLGELGYTAVEAADAAGGLRVLQSGARIDLLVTDVGLPGGLNGRQMADAARATRPDLKVLFITGYAENAVLGNGYLAPGMQVLTKPFAVEALTARVLDMIKDGAGPG